MAVTYIWLLAGIALMVMEVIHVPGVGLMFAGLGSVTTALLISNGLVDGDNTLYQVIAFLLSTTLWTAALWKPLQKLRLGKKNGGYSNIVGETAIVNAGGLNKVMGGDVTWSGTIMKAKLKEHTTVDSVEAGAVVTVVEVTGATLIVTPKN